ncbi:MAG: hypothetical protein NWF03_01830 [Candidatus Bathyarchaeota archaeon]|nr:hypothetical protein [Candidatus Bathyarchaeota archaeon]
MAPDRIIPIGGTHPPEPNNQCNLCKRTVPPSRLTRCPRCKQLYCKSCITEDLYTGEYLICLNCARRYVSPKQSAYSGKYTALTLFLSRKAQWKTWLKLQFSQIEGLIGKDLPATANKTVEWWTKNGSVQTKAWQTIGWNVKEVDLKEKTVTFTRPELIKPKTEETTRKSVPYKLPEYKPRKKKTPSLTRIAVAQARLKNVSRRKSSVKKYRGKFKPRSAYEKRLWSTEEEP